MELKKKEWWHPPGEYRAICLWKMWSRYLQLNQHWKLLNHTKKSERWRPFTVGQKCFSPLIDRASVGRKSEQLEKSGGWSWQLRLGGIKLAFHWRQFFLFGLIDWDSNLTEVWQEDLKRYGTWRPKIKVRHHLISIQYWVFLPNTGLVLGIRNSVDTSLSLGSGWVSTGWSSLWRWW